MKRLTFLGWWLLEAKILYYRPELVNYASPPSDEEYDRKELEYVQLCKELGKNNTISHKHGDGMMEVDLTRPSVQLAIEKLRRTDGRMIDEGE